MKDPPIKVTETEEEDGVTPKKQWTIETPCDDCRGTYEVTLTANYNKVDLVASQSFKLVIIDQCEPSKFTVPSTAAIEWKWHIADTEEIFKLPKVATVPARCEITYEVTIPKALKDVATYNDKGGLVLDGFTSGSNLGDYKFKVQVITPAGFVLDKAKYEVAFSLKAQKKKTPQELLSTVAAATGVLGVASGVAASAAAAAGSAGRPRPPRPGRPAPGPAPAKPAVKVDTGVSATGGTASIEPATGVSATGDTASIEPSTAGGSESFDIDAGSSSSAEASAEFEGGDFGEADASAEVSVDFDG